MIRFALRIAFWGCLIVAILPGTHKGELASGEISLSSIGRAAQTGVADLLNFCDRNSDACKTGQTMISQAAVTAQSSLLSAYHGIKTQNDDIDRETMTGSVAPKK